MTYLVNKYGKSDDDLYPRELIARTNVDQRLYFDTGFLFCRMRFLFEPILYFGCPDVPQDKLDYMELTYGLLERILGENNYVTGDKMTIGDFACVSSISTSEIVLPVDSKKWVLFILLLLVFDWPFLSLFL